MAADGFSKVPLKGTMLPFFLKQLRSNRGWTTSQIANELHVANSTYNDYENGNVNKIPLDRLKAILEIFYKSEKATQPQLSEEEPAISLNSYVIDKLDNEVFATLNKQKVFEQYWALALYFEYSYIPEERVRTNMSHIYALLQELYNLSELDLIFNELDDKDMLFKKNECSVENIVYIYPQKVRGEQYDERETLPIARIRYNLKREYDNNGANFKKYKIKTIDLFTLILNGYLLDDYKIPRAFIETCDRFFEWRIPLIYNFEVYQTKPHIKTPNFDLDKQLLEDLKCVFSKYNSIHTDVLQQFKSNYLTLGTDFLSAIAFDFSFLKKLNSILREKYKWELMQTTEKFKEANLAEEYPKPE